MSTHDIQTGLSDVPDDLITVKWELRPNRDVETFVSAWVKRGSSNAPSKNRSDIDKDFWLPRSKRVRTLDRTVKTELTKMASDPKRTSEDLNVSIPEEIKKIAQGVNDLNKGSVTSIRIVTPSEFQQFKARGEYFDISRNLLYGRKAGMLGGSTSGELC